MDDKISSHERLVQLARQAGVAIMAIYQRGEISVDLKSDHSPLTAADLAAHRILADGLPTIESIPVLSEEGDLLDFAVRRQWQRYWLIDPLDGTREFVARNGEFTVNIALIEQGKPVLGVVHVPALDVTYLGVPGHGAWKSHGAGPPSAIRCRAWSRSDALVTLVSHRHGILAVEQLLQGLEAQGLVVQRISRGSSLKLCLIAEGEADFYPRFGPTSEWDTAAGQALLEAAGGALVDTSFQPLIYNSREQPLNPAFYALGGSIAELSGCLAHKPI